MIIWFRFVGGALCGPAFLWDCYELCMVLQGGWTGAGKYDIIGLYKKEWGMFLIWGILYLLFLVLVVCFVIAWLMMPFELRAVNRNLQEIKDLLSAENNRVKKSRK